MHFLRIIIFLLLFIISFSCKTKLEKQGWQRTAIVSQVNKTAIGKDKELVVQKLQNKGLYYFRIYYSEKGSSGKITINTNKWFGLGELKSDVVYYKWESDSAFFVKLLNQGNVQRSFKCTSYKHGTSLENIQ
jgi:hypothetical protein